MNENTLAIVLFSFVGIIWMISAIIIIRCEFLLRKLPKPEGSPEMKKIPIGVWLLFLAGGPATAHILLSEVKSRKEIIKK